jgi:hypothetical protein
VDAEAATDGWYALLSTPPATVTAAEVLHRDQGQEAVERRYSAFTGPLAVAPMFLNTNRRIEALITVICLALRIFCLVERAVRQAITPDTRMTGRYPGQKAKTHRPPDPPSTKRAAADPGHQRPASAHPAPHPAPSPATRPPSGRPHPTTMITKSGDSRSHPTITHVRNTRLAGRERP